MLLLFYRIMIEEHFYWCLAMERWVILEAEDVPQVFAPTIYPSFLPGFVLRFLYRYGGRTIIGKQAQNAGIGRHTDEEIFRLGL